MKIVELKMRLPYSNRGEVLRKIYSRVSGKIRDVHFLPPSSEGFSEIRMEIVENNPEGLLADLKRTIKNGKISFKVLSEA
jgi:hypothetical protein